MTSTTEKKIIPANYTRRGTNVSNPVVSAMLGSNILSNCNDVKDMFAQCNRYDLGKRQRPMICDTAERYYEACLESAE